MGGGGHGNGEMVATQKELADNQVPLVYRDHCAHMLIPLNKCRTRTYYLPWKCEHERHAYEKCQYDEYMKCVDRMTEQRKQERRAAASKD